MFHTDAMTGAQASPVKAERASHQAGAWSLGVGIWGEYQKNIKDDKRM